MADRPGPKVWTIPAHKAFSDALVAGVLARFDHDPMTLARGTLLVPNSRAGQAIRDAFVRQAEQGLLIPRLVALGDPELAERAGAAIDPLGAADVPPAVDPLTRQLILARLVQQQRSLSGAPVDAAEAMRLAADLARTLDQLIVEEKSVADLMAYDAGALSSHWQVSLDLLTVILSDWPGELARIGRIDLADRRNRLLTRLAERWARTPPDGFVIAVGISTGAPAVARLLATVARMTGGDVVFSALDKTMAEADWNALGGSEDAPAIETHPQFHLWQLLDRMQINRDDVRPWTWGSDVDSRAARALAISHAFAPAESTKDWVTLAPAQRNLSGVTALSFATPADEAQGIAIMLRGVLEVPGQTAALMTPDRALASRVCAHLERWGIAADDSAGQPLSKTPQGGLLLALAEAADLRFAPAALLALLKHPLVRMGDTRLAWLDGARALDLALRGPRPAGGLDGVSAYLAEGDDRQRRVRGPAQGWWAEARSLLEPLEASFTSDGLSLPDRVAALREAAQTLAGDAMWSGEAGRALSTLVAALEADGGHGPRDVSATCLPQLLHHLMDGVAVRPGYGGHPRLFVWGLLEARLQSAHLMVLAGLNEGVWPQLPAPDPWLAPRIRADLGLPSLERRIGLSAHDLASALGAQQVVLTRARRDARSPTIASRFWLRLDTMTGGLSAPTLAYDRLAMAMDRHVGKPERANRPAIMPDPQDRPLTVSVTEVDTLTADPYSFFARSVMGLNALDPVDADPTAAWRGSLIHGVLQAWAEEDDYLPDRLVVRMDAALTDGGFHPLVRALWLPRLAEAAAWIEERVSEGRAVGRVPLVAEVSGALQVHGVTLKGRADRIDRRPDGGLAVIDYKTGKGPSNRQVAEGYATQLGLIGLIAQNTGFDGVAGEAAAFEYWSLARDGVRGFGKITSPVTGKAAVCPAEDFVSRMDAAFREAVETWLTGAEPFIARRRPEYSYGGYNHVMRLEEWEGRDG